MNEHRPLITLFFALTVSAHAAGADFVSLLNGKDLTGWDGRPELWKVEDGIVVGTCAGPESFRQNEFLIWRGGMLKDFELQVTMRVIGDNNSGIQYRSRPLPAAGKWAITGYQCDVHPFVGHNGMTYEERGRSIFGLNGQSVVVDPEGQRWLVAEHQPVEVDVSDWNTYTVVARGNHLVHRINGERTSELTDHDDQHRALEGLLAIQLHHGNANRVEIRQIRLRVLPGGEIKPFDPAQLPEGARRMGRPSSINPQGVGPASDR